MSFGLKKFHFGTTSPTVGEKNGPTLTISYRCRAGRLRCKTSARHSDSRNPGEASGHRVCLVTADSCLAEHSADSLIMRPDSTFPLPLWSKVCDFCAEAVFVKVYACHSFVYLKGTPLEHYACEEWTACSECAELIDAAKWNELTERSLQFFVKHHRLADQDVPLLRDQLHGLHQAFRQYMIPES